MSIYYSGLDYQQLQLLAYITLHMLIREALDLGQVDSYENKIEMRSRRSWWNFF